MTHTLRAHELPPHAGIYLVEQTEDGARSTHIGETVDHEGRQAILDVRTGDIVSVLHVPDDGRLLATTAKGA